MLSYQGVRQSISSTVSVTSGRIFSAAEATIISLIGMTIFNNGLQFIIGEGETFMEIISAAKNVSRDYKLPGKEMVQGPLLDNFLRTISRTNVRSYYMGQTYMDLIFKVMVQQSRTLPSLISWLGVFTYMCHFKILWNVQVTSQVVKIRMLFFCG